MATQFDGTANPYLEIGHSILQEEMLIPLNEALVVLGMRPSELWPETPRPLDQSLLVDFLASQEPITVERIRQLFQDNGQPDITDSEVDDFLETLLEVIR